MPRATFNWKLPQAIETRLGRESYGAQRAIYEEDHLLLVLHEPPTGDGGKRDHAIFLRRPDGKWLYHGVDNGDQALRQLLDRYGKLLAEQEKRYAKADTADELFHILDQATPVARAAGNLSRALQSAREMVKQDPVLIDGRDRSVDIARGLELLVGDARLALDYRLARNAEEQVQAAMATTRAQHKLNILAAWTLPLMTLATVFGMNLQSGMEGFPMIYFWGVFLAGLMLGMVAKGWVQPSEPRVKKPQAARKGL